MLFTPPVHDHIVMPDRVIPDRLCKLCFNTLASAVVSVWVLNATWTRLSDWSVEAGCLWRSRQQQLWTVEVFFFMLLWTLQLACSPMLLRRVKPKRVLVQVSVWNRCGLLLRCRRRNKTEPSVILISLRNYRGGPPSATQVCKQNSSAGASSLILAAEKPVN